MLSINPSIHLHADTTLVCAPAACWGAVGSGWSRPPLIRPQAHILPRMRYTPCSFKGADREGNVQAGTSVELNVEKHGWFQQWLYLLHRCQSSSINNKHPTRRIANRLQTQDTPRGTGTWMAMTPPAVSAIRPSPAPTHCLSPAAAGMAGNSQCLEAGCPCNACLTEP